MEGEETQGQYAESKISVFFLSRENYLQASILGCCLAACAVQPVLTQNKADN